MVLAGSPPGHDGAVTEASAATPEPAGPPTPDTVLALVEAHVLSVLGQDSGRAGVTFLGVQRIDVLRFGPDSADLYRYVTVGLSREPMTAPSAVAVDPPGPRAELVLSLRGQHDSVLRGLATLAAAPSVEGVVITPGVTLDLGAPLWPGARATGVLVAEPGGLVAALSLEGASDVAFLPVLPLLPEEAAFKRIHGADALQERWLHAGTDLRDPHRRPVGLR